MMLSCFSGNLFKTEKYIFICFYIQKLQKVWDKKVKSIKKVWPDWKKLDVVWSKVPKPDLSKIKNEKLRKIVKQQYRDNAEIWNWSTADVIRYEKKIHQYFGVISIWGLL